MNEQKKLTPELEGRVQQAVENFMQGYGCCQIGRASCRERV